MCSIAVVVQLHHSCKKYDEYQNPDNDNIGKGLSSGCKKAFCKVNYHLKGRHCPITRPWPTAIAQRLKFAKSIDIIKYPSII